MSNTLNKGDETDPINGAGRFLNDDTNGRFRLVNRNVYEIYHEDNVFNFLTGTYVIHGPTTNVTNNINEPVRIGRIRNDTNADVVYLYYDQNDNEHEICTCVITRNVPFKNGGTQLLSVPAGGAAQAVPVGGDAQTHYSYADGTIVTTGTFINPPSSYNAGNARIARYTVNAGVNVDLIRMPDTLNIEFNLANQNNINPDVILSYEFYDTQRRYCNPVCFAAFIGVLAETSNDDVEVSGICFSNGTCYPSLGHSNGDSVDTRYLGTLQTRGLAFSALMANYDAVRQNTFAEAFRTWGFSYIIAGSYSPRFDDLDDNVHKQNSQHDDHLHAGDLPAVNVFTII